RLRKSKTRLGIREVVRRVGRESEVGRREAIETAHRRESPRCRTRGKSPSAQVAEISDEVAPARFARGGATRRHPAPEGFEVRSVRGDAGARQPPLHREVVEVRRKGSFEEVARTG